MVFKTFLMLYNLLYMITKELIDYLKIQRASGKKDDEIRRGLVSEGGWTASDLNEVFAPAENNLKKETEPQKHTFFSHYFQKAYVFFLLSLILQVYYFSQDLTNQSLLGPFFVFSLVFLVVAMISSKRFLGIVGAILLVGAVGIYLFTVFFGDSLGYGFGLAFLFIILAILATIFISGIICNYLFEHLNSVFRTVTFVLIVISVIVFAGMNIFDGNKGEGVIDALELTAISSSLRDQNSTVFLNVNELGDPNQLIPFVQTLCKEMFFSPTRTDACVRFSVTRLKAKILSDFTDYAYKQAEASKSVSSCLSFKDNYDANECITKNAASLEDCDLIREDDQNTVYSSRAYSKEVCISNFAVKTKDLNLCNGLSALRDSSDFANFSQQEVCVLDVLGLSFRHEDITIRRPTDRVLDVPECMKAYDNYMCIIATDDFKSRHFYLEDFVQLFRGSEYVSSDLNSIKLKCAAHLNNSRFYWLDNNLKFGDKSYTAQISKCLD